MILDQASICNCILPGPVALAVENVPDEPTATAIAATTTTTTTTTKTTKSITANITTTTTTTQNGSDTSNEKNATTHITKNFKLIYKADFNKTVTDLGGLWAAKDAFCKSWLSSNLTALVNCSISEGRTDLLLEI